MAPLNKDETGCLLPADNIPQVSPNLVASTAALITTVEGNNAVGGRPDERRGLRGGYSHGVIIFAGGIPHDVKPPKELNHGTVLATCPDLRCDDSHELQIKPGTEDERVGRGYSFNYTPALHSDVPVQLQELNHGTVLHTFDNLKPDLSYEGSTNIIRPTERVSKKGGFIAGVRVLRGGPARDVRPPRDLSNHGTVLAVYPDLKCDDSHELQIKPGTEDERVGRGYSFNYTPALHSEMPVERELDHGIVLFTFSNLRPDLSYEGNTNVAGNRPDERLGRSHGGFAGGSRLWCGGSPRDIPIPQGILPGTVLYTRP